MSLMTDLFRRVPAKTDGLDLSDTPKHLGWIMLAALGIGATIGAGIFAMPGMIAGLAGPAGILSFVITGVVILFVAICYEKFSRLMPNGTSAYSYTYNSIGEIVAWIVSFGLFMEYSFGASAVAIAWSVYLKTACNFHLPDLFWEGPRLVDGHYVPGINIIAIGVTAVITLVLIYGGVSKSAKLNLMLVILKVALLIMFLAVGIPHINPANWQPFMPMGIHGVLQGAAVAVFPFVGFDALYTFARESKSQKDTKLGTFFCIALVSLLYVTVMATATGLAPCFVDGHKNELFVGSEAAAPLAKLLAANGEAWTAQFIAGGAVLGIFNVLLVLCMGGPRIFRNMAEDGLLPPIFKKVKNGNPTYGILLNGVLVAGFAGFMEFSGITHMMVLGTLVAFSFVCIGAMRLKAVSPLVAIPGLVGCVTLACNLEHNVLIAYGITCPIGLLIYFFYGYKHSKLARAEAALAKAPEPETKLEQV